MFELSQEHLGSDERADDRKGTIMARFTSEEIEARVAEAAERHMMRRFGKSFMVVPYSRTWEMEVGTDLRRNPDTSLRSLVVTVRYQYCPRDCYAVRMGGWPSRNPSATVRFRMEPSS